MDYFYINAITLGTVSTACFVSVWLPMPRRGLFFKAVKAAPPGPPGPEGPDKPVTCEDDAGSGGEKMENSSTGCAGWCSRGVVAAGARLLWQSFKESYSSRYLFVYFIDF